MDTTTHHGDLATAYDRAAAPLTELIDSVPTEGWDAPSPCEGWAARDVLGHVVDARRSFLTDKGADLAQQIEDLRGIPAQAEKELN